MQTNKQKKKKKKKKKKLEMRWVLKTAELWLSNKLSSHVFPIKGNGYSFGDVTLSDFILPPSEKGYTLKGNKMLPLWVNSFFIRVDLITEEAWCVGKILNWFMLDGLEWHHRKT